LFFCEGKRSGTMQSFYQIEAIDDQHLLNVRLLVLLLIQGIY
jgi:hypothetical protein